MHIADAIYTLSAIRQTGSRSGSSSRHRPVLPNPESSAPSDHLSENLTPNTAPTSAGKLDTLSEMLTEHFAEEVRQRDRDGDGQLTQSEFGGPAEVFAALDRDGNGRIRASDLIHAALQKNPELEDMVTGPRAPIYNAILNANSDDPAILEVAVRNGAAETAQQMRLQVRQSNGEETGNPDASAIPSPTRQAYEEQVRVGAVMDEFLNHHDDLALLRDRLNQLADRLGRARRYHPVNKVA